MSVTTEIKRLECQTRFLYEHSRFLEEHEYENVGAGEDDPTYLTTIVGLDVYISFHGPDAKALMAETRRRIGGKWNKNLTTWSLTLTQGTYPDPLRIQLFADREAVCTKKVVGTKTVTIPAIEAEPERTVEEEVVEWDCEPILSD